jgi:hypothetical protein
VRFEGVGVDRTAQVGFQVEDARGFVAHRFVEHRAAIAARALGAIHRRVRVAQHVFAAAIARHPQGDADARGGEQFAAGDPHRRTERAEHAAGEFFGHALPVDLFDQDREFVAAQGARRCRRCAPPRRCGGPASISNSSPTAWPTESLTSLKRSRSRKSTANVRLRPARCARAGWRGARRSSNCARSAAR